ncbi:MAG: long-chain-fatty-acid--CoA ligase [Deltaproteobacteria bacterium]|nr:long-chain-fatty-acid--CoA ligase [Deltaproteobacteria bacterium]
MLQLTVGNALTATVEHFPGKTAFVFEGKRVTYAQFEERVNRLANGLLAKGFKPGDRVAILAFNCIEYYEILFALGKVGMVAAPINFRLVGDEIVYIVNHCDAKALIYEARFKDALDKIRGHLGNIGLNGYIVFGGEGEPGDLVYEDLLAGADPSDPGVQVDEKTTWYIGYTSGTTGRPKGAMRSHRCSVLLAMNMPINLTELDNILMIMPIFHSNSIWFGLIGVFQGTTTVIYPSGGFDPREILEIIEKEKITFSSLVPTMYTLILSLPDKEKYNTDSLRNLLTSSAPLTSRTKEQILEFFKNVNLFEGYGATETGASTMLLPEFQYSKVRSCGRAAPLTRIMILDENGRKCGPGEVGELYACSPSMFEGYCKQPEADKKAFHGEFASVGDMAKVDEEGFYYIVDRKNDMIISGGENIYPTEIDDALAKHPKVQQVAVIGVPDEKWGEAVKAIIISEPGVEVTEAEIIAFSKEHLAGYKCPKSVEFWDSLPTNPTGKILKRVIREKYWEDHEAKI